MAMTPELRAFATEVAAKWRDSLSRKDWRLDGRPVEGIADLVFERLDWSRAWIDLGPSPAGNIGPYWHVPVKGGDTVHRLYPKIPAKWHLLVLHACLELSKKSDDQGPST